MGRSRIVIVVLATLVVAGFATYLVLRPDTSPAPASKKALAAVAVDVLDIEPSSYEPNPSYDVPEPLGVVVLWHPGGSSDAHRLHLDVSPSTAGAASCGGELCDSWGVDGGEILLSWQEEAPEEDPGILTVAFVTDGAEGETRSVTYSGAAIGGDPRDQDGLPVSVEQLVDVVTDDRFASTTTQAMVEADLAKWPEEEAAAAAAVATTPQVVAQWLMESTGEPVRAVAADTAAYGPDAVGTEFRFRNRTTSVVIVPANAASVPACGSGWHCSKPKRSWQNDGRVITGWQQGQARIWIEYEDRTVLASVRSPRFDRFPRPAWKYGPAGWDVDGLVDGYATWSLHTTREVRDSAADLPWFEE